MRTVLTLCSMVRIGGGVHYFVSAGLLRPKKAECRVNRLNRYLNYGLLSLATMAAKAGASVRVLHGGFETPISAFADLVAQNDVESILMSLPSSYSLPWAKEFVAHCRRHNPNLKITCGGRWTVDGRESWIRKLLDVDDVVSGLGEDYVSRRFNGKGFDPRSTPGDLDYSLMADFRDFQPSVEVSRGCARGCSFCVEASNPLTKPRKPHEVAAQLLSLKERYDGYTIRPYLQASLFNPSECWIEMFKDAIGTSVIEWRTETRADSLTAEKVSSMAAVGLRVLDVGLESASPSQLIAMGKTRNPDRYLSAASDLLAACSESGVMVKLNILLYPGETRHSLEQTVKWLHQHRDHFQGISANPVIFYPYGKNSNLPATFEARGASLVNPAQLSDDGYADLNLSSEFSNVEALNACLDVSREFMTMRSYFEIKKFGYFAPHLSWSTFTSVARLDDPRQLPFIVDDFRGPARESGEPTSESRVISRQPLTSDDGLHGSD